VTIIAKKLTPSPIFKLLVFRGVGLAHIKLGTDLRGYATNLPSNPTGIRTDNKVIYLEDGSAALPGK
jgi:hypothetical protein